MAVDGICELVLEAEESEPMERFYLALGLERLSSEDDKVWLAAGRRSRLGIWPPGAQEHGDRGGRHVHFALSAPPGTLDEVAERLRGEGHEVEGPVAHDGGDRSLYLTDPAGNRIELWDVLHRSDAAGVGATAD